jgi:hypothetical protein
MVKTLSFKRLILRAVLHQVSPMVIRLVSVADQMPLHEFHDVYRTILGRNGDLGYIVRVHGQEFNSFRRKPRSKALHEFKLHRQEKFLYVCDTLHMWEWDVRVLDIQEGVEGDRAPVCLGGRGAAPPEFCGGPTGYRLISGNERAPQCPILCGWRLVFRCWPRPLRVNRHGPGICSAPCWTTAFRASIEDCTNSDLCNLSVQLERG